MFARTSASAFGLADGAEQGREKAGDRRAEAPVRFLQQDDIGAIFDNTRMTRSGLRLQSRPMHFRMLYVAMRSVVGEALTIVASSVIGQNASPTRK